MENATQLVTPVTDATPDEVTIPNQVNVQDTGPAANSNPVTDVTTVNDQRLMELCTLMISEGILAEGHVVDVVDEGIIRFPDAEDSGGKTTGWASMHLDESGALVAATCGTWRDPDAQKDWFFNGYDALTEVEKECLKAVLGLKRFERQELVKAEQQEAVSHLNQWIETLTEWSESSEHQYIDNKGVKVNSTLYHSGNQVVVPLTNSDGELVSAQLIAPDGSKMLRKGCPKKGAFHLIQGSKDAVLITEGLATAMSIHESTGYTTVMAVDAGNLKTVTKAIKGMPQYKRSGFVLCGDNDQYGSKNVGKEKAEAAAESCNTECAIPEFQNTINMPTDFNDLHQSEGLDEVYRQLEPSIETALLGMPPRYFLKEDGVYFIDEKPEKICSRIVARAFTRDRKSSSWGVNLLLIDEDDVEHNIAVAKTDIIDRKGCISFLSPTGFRCVPGQEKRFHYFINEQKPVRRAVCTETVGWKGESFILPDGMIGENNELVVLQTRGEIRADFEQQGTLEEWQENVSLLCKGNPRLILGLSAGFASPLLPLMGGECCGIHFRGGSSRGKTTILKVAKSIWGNPDTMPMWRTTDNGLEATANQHNNTLLCLDEIGQLEPKVAGKSVYMLGNGEGKGRADRAGGAAQNQKWRLYFLSSGELSLADLMSKAGEQTMAGQSVRFIDLSAESNSGMGAFDDIHDYGSAGLFANALNKNSNEYYGTASRAFLEYVTADYEGIAAKAEQYRDSFVSTCNVLEADPQVQRVARRFGELFAGGQIATDLGITCWDASDVMDSCTTCFNTWLEERGDDGSHEKRAILEYITNKLQTEGHRHFTYRDEASGLMPYDAGVNGVLWGHHFDGKYHVFPSIFRRELCGDHNHASVCNVLDELGFLDKASDGKPTKPVRVVPRENPKRVYVIQDSLLSENEEVEAEE